MSIFTHHTAEARAAPPAPHEEPGEVAGAADTINGWLFALNNLQASSVKRLTAFEEAEKGSVRMHGNGCRVQVPAFGVRTLAINPSSDGKTRTGRAGTKKKKG